MVGFKPKSDGWNSNILTSCPYIDKDNHLFPSQITGFDRVDNHQRTPGIVKAREKEVNSK